MKQSEFEATKERIAANMASEMYIHILEKLLAKAHGILESDATAENKVTELRTLLNPYVEIRVKGATE